MDDVTSLLVEDSLFSVRTGLWNGEMMTLIEGAPSDWKGTTRVSLYGPDGSGSTDWTVPMVSSSELDFRYRFESDGHPILNITVQGLPFLINTSESFAGGVTNLPLSVTMDASTTPVVGGGLTLALVALVFRKRLSSPYLFQLNGRYEHNGVCPEHGSQKQHDDHLGTPRLCYAWA